MAKDLLAEHLKSMLAEELEVELDTLELFNETLDSPLENKFIIPKKTIKYKKENKILKLKENMDYFLGNIVDTNSTYKMEYEYKKNIDGEDSFYFSIIKKF